MASIIKRRNKSGNLSYHIRVYSGKDERGRFKTPFATTYHPEPGWTEKKSDKKAEEFAAIFEHECKSKGLNNTALTFEEYAERVLQHKSATGVLKSTTLAGYRCITKRIYPTLGKRKLKDIKPQTLNDFYDFLLKCGKQIEPSAIAKAKFKKVYENKNCSYEGLRAATGVSLGPIGDVMHGKPIKLCTAEKLASALGFDVKELFFISFVDEPLSAKTVLEHHRFISSILAQAEKELLVPYNAAQKATPPKASRPKVNYYEPEQIKNILAAFDKELIQRKAFGYFLVFSGARRGELMGLEWKNVDFEKNRIKLERNVLYLPERGTFVDTLKTETSERLISLPKNVMNILAQYRDEWYNLAKEMADEFWEDNGFVFVTPTGQHMSPDGVSTWLRRVEEKNDLPHLNAHAFRHSVASALIFAGVDPVSVSRRLGHNQVNTTTNFYAHIMSQADDRNAEILDELF